MQTMMVVQAAQMLGFQVERINFSANISMESLAGGYMPRVVDGRRTFEASVLVFLLLSLAVARRATCDRTEDGQIHSDGRDQLGAARGRLSVYACD